MAAPKFKNLQQYEDFIDGMIAPWSSERRTVLAAAAAERWFTLYEDFSTAETWGDPLILRRSLDSVWNWIDTRRISSNNWSKLKQEVQKITPHMDDFDANEALCACAMVQYAIECCDKTNNHNSALMALLSGLEALVPGILDDEEIPAHTWKQSFLRKEIEKQLSLLEQVAALKELVGARQVLQSLFMDPQIIDEARAWQDEDQAPPGRTNQQAFEQYQKIVQMDIGSSSARMDPGKDPFVATILYLGTWMSRYGRRKQIISGEYGPLADQRAVELLRAKNHALDLAEPRQPEWDQTVRYVVNLCYQNPDNGLDAPTPESPHGYGPSARRLWVHAKSLGLSDQQAWESIESWAHHQPAGWNSKTHKQMLKTGKTSLAMDLGLEQPYSWSSTKDPYIPWFIQIDGVLWQVRLNDFPDEIMYSLLGNGEWVTDFHDWPPAWIRE